MNLADLFEWMFEHQARLGPELLGFPVIIDGAYPSPTLMHPTEAPEHWVPLGEFSAKSNATEVPK